MTSTIVSSVVLNVSSGICHCCANSNCFVWVKAYTSSTTCRSRAVRELPATPGPHSKRHFWHHHPICQLAHPAGFSEKRAASNPWIPLQASSLTSTPFIQFANLFSLLFLAETGLPATLGPQSKRCLWHCRSSPNLPGCKDLNLLILGK